MFKKLAALSTATIAVCLSGSVSAQITITNSGNDLTPEQYVHVLTGPENGLQTESEIYTGAPIAIGTFSGGTSIFGIPMEEGIILSSGSVFGDTGSVNTVDDFSVSNGTPGDTLLDGLSGYPTYDAAVLEFDFTCADLQEISFLFVFASEEYNEWVESDFNDVFGFFLDGINVALVPVVSPVPISINTINNGGTGFDGSGWGVNPVNPGFYRNNNQWPGTPASADEGLPFEMDGLTILMAVDVPLADLPSHHMKLAIADASDTAWDSAVFIAANTFTCGDPLAVELDHFRGAMRSNGEVYLGWATLSEIDNAGFNIYRQSYSDRPLVAPAPGSVLINPDGMIAARGNPVSSTSYRWVDHTAQRHETYIYWLEDIDTSGLSTFHGPIVVR